MSRLPIAPCRSKHAFSGLRLSVAPASFGVVDRGILEPLRRPGAGHSLDAAEPSLLSGSERLRDGRSVSNHPADDIDHPRRSRQSIEANGVTARRRHPRRPAPASSAHTDPDPSLLARPRPGQAPDQRHDPGQLGPDLADGPAGPSGASGRCSPTPPCPRLSSDRWRAPRGDGPVPPAAAAHARRRRALFAGPGFAGPPRPAADSGRAMMPPSWSSPPCLLAQFGAGPSRRRRPIPGAGRDHRGPAGSR